MMTVTPDRVEEGRPLLIAGMNAAYTLQTRSEIPEQWLRFAPQIGRIPGQKGMTSYGVCWNVGPDNSFDYLCGVEVEVGSPLPPNFTQLQLAPQRYAVFVHDDHVSAVPATIDAIWSQWLPASGFTSAQSPCFERYTEQFDPQAGRGGTEIWIPLKG